MIGKIFPWIGKSVCSAETAAFKKSGKTRKKSSAPRPAHSRENGNASNPAKPHARTARSFCRSVANKSGARSGFKTCWTCGENVKHSATPPKASASAAAARNTA